MTPEQSALMDRIRPVVADAPVQREVSMFGGRAVMVNDAMIVSALKDGGLLVRVDPERHDELLGQPEARQSEMGAGRSMGAGWIRVAPAGVAEDDRLQFWLARALEYNGVTGR